MPVIGLHWLDFKGSKKTAQNIFNSPFTVTPATLCTATTREAYSICKASRV